MPPLRLLTPYHIFIRAEGRLSDSDLLTRFGLGHYARTDGTFPPMGCCAALADDGPWTLLADDLCYTLWHLPTTRPVIAELAEEFDVFACSVGDCDESFDFDYYRDGQLVRRHVVASPSFHDHVIVENLGDPLPIEATLQHTNGPRMILEIGQSLGLRMEYRLDEVRLYVPSKKT